jgi:hypothetical protein
MKRKERIMKKRLICTGLFLLVTFCLFSQSSGWYDCTINMMGPQTTGEVIYIWLNDLNENFSNKIFQAHPDFKKEIYVAALMAFAMDYKVRVYVTIDPNSQYNCFIKRLYMFK